MTASLLLLLLLFMSCAVTAQPVGDWMWLSGSDTVNVAGVYGTQGVESASVFPGSRIEGGMDYFEDSLYLFGGRGHDKDGNVGNLNDLWRFNLTTEHWTWLSGSDTHSSVGSYGNISEPSSSNLPSSRQGPAVLIHRGRKELIVFGGWPTGAFGGDAHSDVWKYDLETGIWTWIHGDPPVDQATVYGTLGVEAESNAAGARAMHGAAMDEQNDRMLIHGGYNDFTSWELAADLWSFSLQTHRWTWIGGSDQNAVPPTYVEKNSETIYNQPGSRSAHQLFVYSNFVYIVAGIDYRDSTFMFNDVWRFNFENGLWTWVKGSNSTSVVSGVFGTKDVPDEENDIPSIAFMRVVLDAPRERALMFGGNAGSGTRWNTLWDFDIATRVWTWRSGSNTTDAPGVFGQKGVPDAQNVPPVLEDHTIVATEDSFYVMSGQSSFTERYNTLWHLDLPSSPTTEVPTPTTEEEEPTTIEVPTPTEEEEEEEPTATEVPTPTEEGPATTEVPTGTTGTTDTTEEELLPPPVISLSVGLFIILSGAFVIVLVSVFLLISLICSGTPSPVSSSDSLPFGNPSGHDGNGGFDRYSSSSSSYARRRYSVPR